MSVETRQARTPALRLVRANNLRKQVGGKR
jgi:hypothetical protein